MERSSGAAPSPRRGRSDPAAPSALTVHIADAGDGTARVALLGELYLGTIRKAETVLLEQVTQRPAVLVDLSSLTFIDSSGIGTLIRALRSANGTPVNVVIGPGSQVERVFRIAGVSEALRVFTDPERALAGLAAARDGHSQDAAG